MIEECSSIAVPLGRARLNLTAGSGGAGGAKRSSVIGTAVEVEEGRRGEV